MANNFNKLKIDVRIVKKINDLPYCTKLMISVQNDTNRYERQFLII